VSGPRLDYQHLATKVRAAIRHRRCLICSKTGEDHRIVISDGLAVVAIMSEDGEHRYDPGERRLGLPR
jgi:hypothetical protein